MRAISVALRSALLNTVRTAVIHDRSSNSSTRRSPTAESGQSGTGTDGSTETSGWVMKWTAGITIRLKVVCPEQP